jgi:ACS family tartrate transporter-like MFS transporter
MELTPGAIEPGAAEARSARRAPDHADQALERLGTKMIWRLILPLAFFTFVNAIDRVNVSFAAHAMGADIGLTPATFGLGVGAFFLAYLIFQYPHAALLRKLGIRRWLLGSVLLWGLSGVLLARVETVGEFLAARFLLGTAEAGFAPGVTYFVNRWLPVQVRAKAMATILAAVPVSLVVGGPLCGWMLGMTNPFDIAGWRWMFLLQAIPNFALAFIAYFYFKDDVAESRWLTPDERTLLAPAAAPPSTTSLRDVVTDSRVWRCALTWILVMTGSYALIFWIPQLVRQMTIGDSEFEIGMLSAFPQVGLVLGMLVNGWHSDRSGERRWHVALAAGFGGIALLGGGLLPAGWPALMFLFAASAGIGAAQSVFWAVPGEMKLGGDQVPVAAISFISIFGTMGGFLGPMLIGGLVQVTGSFVPALVLLALLLVVAALIMAPPRGRNGARELK